MIEKLKYLVTEICKENNDVTAVDIIQNSQLQIIEYGDLRGGFRFTGRTYGLCFNLNPALFIKHVDDLERVADIIKYYFSKVTSESQFSIKKVEIKPDYEKIIILNSNISIIETPWEEINSLQKKLIENMKIADSSIDFQNIGNSARTIMDKMARLVFDSSLHVAPEGVDIRNGKFKNQLHTYLDTVLKGKSNKELKSFSISAIDFTEKSIDLMNQTTHKLDVQKHFGEVCVISTISVISLLKAVNEL